jgi:hypothetical protein
VSKPLEWTDILEDIDDQLAAFVWGTALYLGITFFRRAQSRRHNNRTYLIGVVNEELLVAIAVNGTITNFASPLPSEDAARQHAEGWERK